MKKQLSFLLLLVLSFTFSYAQTMKDVKTNFALQKYKEAQANINAVLADASNASKPEPWYYKGQIYSILSSDSTLNPAQAYNLKLTALEAYKKLQALDAKDEYLSDDKYRPYLYLYDGFYNLGVTQFNAKNYKGSYDAFNKALEVEDYTKNKGYKYTEITFPAFDTALVMNVAAAAYQAKDTSNAIAAYNMFATSNIGGKDAQQVYEILIQHYSAIKDRENATKIIEQARKLYPGEDLWDDFTVRLAGSGSKEELYKKYDELLAQNPTSFPMAYNYAVELYNSLYAKDEKRPADIAATKAKLTTVLNQAIANDKTADALMLMTNHLFNIGADYSTEQTMATDSKKKADLKKKTEESMTAVIPYAEKVLLYINALPEPTLKDRANKKNVLGYLMDIYDIKGDKVKSDMYKKQRAEVVI